MKEYSARELGGRRRGGQVGAFFHWQPLEVFGFFFSVQDSLSTSSVQSLSHVRLFATSWTAARQASLSFPIPWSLLKLMSIESVMPSNHLHPLSSPTPPASIFLSIRVFSNKRALHIRWPKYWSFSFSISPSDEYSGLISFRTD